MDIQIVLLIMMVMIIWAAHVNIYQNQDTRFMKIMVIMSFILFLIIFIEHYIYAKKKSQAKDKQTVLTKQDLDRLGSDDIFKSDNVAVPLFNRLMSHPIFLWI